MHKPMKWKTSLIPSPIHHCQTYHDDQTVHHDHQSSNTLPNIKHQKTNCSNNHNASFVNAESPVSLPFSLNTTINNPSKLILTNTKLMPLLRPGRPAQNPMNLKETQAILPQPCLLSLMIFCTPFHSSNLMTFFNPYLTLTPFLFLHWTTQTIH